MIVALGSLSISTYALFYSYGLFLEPLQTALNASKTALSTAYMMYMAVYSISSAPMGFLCDRFGPRKVLWLSAFLIGIGISLCSSISSVWQLTLYFGFIAALGQGAVFVVPTSTTARWFIGKRGLAIGIINAGLGVFLLIVPPVVSRLINWYGWQTAFIVLGVAFFALNGFVATFMRARPEDKGLQPLAETAKRAPLAGRSSPTHDFTVKQALKSKAFILLYLISLFGFAAEQMVLVHVVSYSGAVGITPTGASLGVSFLGAGIVVGRLLGGAMSDRMGRVLTLTLFCAAEAASIFGLLAVQGQGTLYSSMFLLGLGYGGASVVSSVILADYFGSKNLGAITGIWISRAAPAGILGPLVGGITFDLTDSYWWALMFAGILCAATVILAAILKPPKLAP
ncbi:MAG: MFS transporter [Chloroflexi bacterium]|nr:MFS transporter [Chloroflexota bacterium]